MLKLIGITKEYKVEQESILALNNVSIEFRRNEFVSILGPSGCGKTTLLNIIGGLDRYTSGDIQIEGVSTKQYDDVDWDTYRNRRIGFVFQSYNLIPHMNILGNVSLSLTLAGVGREERKERALEALRKVGLEAQAKKKPNQLSGGQMQRVAIARALVNNPEIILADEPTGALDSESGYQVMDLLKEVAQDRLVIMVTHNPTLADEYSTRIVSLKDGCVVGDTMPYDSAKEDVEAVAPCEAEETELAQATTDIGDSVTDAESETVRTDEEVQPAQEGEAEEEAPKKRNFFTEMKERMLKKRTAGKSAMKLTTAINLSWNNLISKKGRTLLTSIAGSIGIIGIVMVLALSNGASKYIYSLEESALSNYPISVNQSTLDFESLLGTLMNSMAEDDGKFDEDIIRVQEVLGRLIPVVMNSLQSSQNDLHTFKQYVDKNFDNKLADVKYEYGTTFNCYVADKLNDTRYMKVNPYTETMNIVFMQIIDQAADNGLNLKDQKFNILGQEMTISEALGYMSSMFGNVWSEISNNRELLNNQYTLVGGKRSRWPESEDEIVIVVNEDNRIMDFQLFMLGLQSQDEVSDALFGSGQFAPSIEYSLDDLFNLQFKVMTNSDYLEDGPEDGTWVMHKRTEQSVDYVDENCVKFHDGSDHLRVVGIVRPKPGSVASSISGIVGYSSQLTSYLLQHSAEHPAVKELLSRYNDPERVSITYESPIQYRVNADGTEKSGTQTGMDIDIGDEIEATGSNEDNHYLLLRQLGFVDVEYPLSIKFYCSSFDSKDAVERFIQDYNSQAAQDKQITYADSLATMMRFIDTMVTTITGVLVAFAAISLIVSTIMIAIIIYTSVLERRKEIGVLRSIGARKKDISRVFIAESAILGGYSGVIGIGVSFVLSLIVSRVLQIIFGIAGLMTVTWYHCLLMLGISVLLSMLAGFIPSRIAANKDPAIELRSE